jgi:protein ImuB
MPRAARIACLAVPLFPLAARLRSEPELAGEALAVVAGDGERARVVAATRRARRAGVEPGQTLPQARALCSELAVRGHDPECERAAQAALVEAAEGASPRVEDAGDGVAYADASGLERLFAGDAELGAALAAAAERAGLPARVGIAASKLAARVAAETGSFQDGSPVIVVPAGGEAEFLAPLPLGRLAPEVALAETLARWGVGSVGELARLPAAEVASRLGPDGERLHAIARGRDPRPLVPRRPPPRFREGMALEWPVVQLEPLLFVGRAALERLTGRLTALGLACSRLEVELRLEPAGWDQRAFDLPAPTREVKTLLTLVRLDLEARSPGAPVAGFAFVAHSDAPRAAQLTLFGPRALSPDRLATTLARLFALLGPDRVGSPRPADGHRPEGFALAPFAPPPPPEVRPAPPAARPNEGGRGLMAVRALRPPLPIEVITAAAERPQAVAPLVAAGGEALAEDDRAPRSRNGARPEVRGRVRVAAGPWRLEEGWWTGEPADRDYWDVELESGGLYRIYRDRAAGEWFADGIYD